MNQLFNRRSVLGQFQPFLTPTLPVLDQANGIASPDAAPVPPNAGPKGALVATSLIAGGLAATSGLFMYGVASEAQSRMVKWTGYTLAAVSGLSALAYLVGGPLLASLSGDRK